MKKWIALVLAIALAAGCLAGIVIADNSTDVIAKVQTGDVITECRSNTEIVNAISTDGTSVVTMLQDCVIEGGTFLWNVPSFTMNLNGFTVGSTSNNAITVNAAGTANAVTNIVGPGVVTAGNNAICIRAGSVNVEQGVTAYSANLNALLIDDAAADNSESCVKDSVLVAEASAPVRFGAVDYVNLSLSDTTVVAAASGVLPVGCGSSTPTNTSVTLGSGVKFYTTGEVCVFSGCTTNYLEYAQYKDSDDQIPTAELIVQTTDKTASTNVYALDKAYSGLNCYVTRIPETVNMRQQAMIETAMAYYHKGVNVQYDRKALYWGGRTYGVRTYLNEMNAPEYASEHLTLYSVCSTFAYDVIYNTFGYALFGDLHKAVTVNMADGNFLMDEANLSKEDQVAVIYSWDESSETSATDAAAAAYELVQPGDVITYYRYGESGHAVIYAYDLNGDGNPDLINSGSKAPGQQRYDLDNGVDYEEVNGTVFFNNGEKAESSGLDSAYNYLFNPNVKSQYLGNTDVLSATSSSRITRFTVMRPVNMQYTLTDAVRTRMENPGLEIVYNTRDTSYYGSVVQGSELTYELTLTNHGNQYINNAEETSVLDVVIPVPQGTSLVSVNGKEKTGDTVAFTAVVPYGETVTYTYTVRVTAGSGSLIRALNGKIGNIALPKLNTTVTSYMPTAEAMQAEAVRAAAAKAESSGAAFANAWYLAAFGQDPHIPELSEIIKNHFTRKTSTSLSYIGYEPNGYVSAKADPDIQCNLPDMMVPNYYGGRSLRVTNTSQRVLKTRVQDLLPGDVLLIDEDLMDEVEAVAWVYDGEKLWALEDGQLVEKTAEGHYDAEKPYLLTGDMTKLHSYDFFMLLRPAQLPTPVLAAGNSWLGDVGEIPNLSKVEIVDQISDSSCTNVIKTWDASADQSGAVTGTLFDNGDGTCTLTMAGNGYGCIYANADSSSLFSCLSCDSSYTISGLDVLDTSNVTDMSGMFSSDGMLTGTLDLSGFDTTNVTDMEGMFYGSNIQTIYVSDKWSTEKVTSDFHMFGENWKLTGGSSSKWSKTMGYDKSYAKIDGGSMNPGYLTEK